MPDDQKRGSSDDKPAIPHRKEPEPKPSAGASADGQEGRSLASRIQDSAAGLAKNVFSPSAPPSAETAQLLAGSGKASSSSSTSFSASQSALAAAQQYHDTTRSSSSRAEQSTQSQTFRSSSPARVGGFELPSLAEDEFQRTYGETSLDSNDGMYLAAAAAAATAPAAAGLSTVDRDKGKGRWTRSDDSHIGEGGGSSLEEIEQGRRAAADSSDGAAVVSLLSDSTFDPNFPASADEPADIIETDLSAPVQLTPAEIQIIESFRRALPASSSSGGGGSSSSTNHLNPRSLVPDIGSFLETVPSTTNSEAVVLRDAVLTGLPGAADWLTVEERYHDEVWGYLQPTLEAAQQEMQSTKKNELNGEPVDEGPAVRRLRMILKHMQTGPA
ncbi:uncharacterized protein BP01DRAFT_360646 [Aspergillus saccharolyticus JOP 1030-1]|uniref:Uncharacterized protein n=1 Tax=Aspergillus saccharolyticus JOP 1030-1 TaxID=1450539 RepID=A0A318ZLV1_9EURO|nr:hypothetical protein BP01DRAFT_360646 [Aspergillus saccharolyticus JOP 1030-1]PYH41228.1 hypothetical protein BP01DRAFT_360646 [Aspergillus saccharolyticus JOP 1030-1]